MIYLTSQWFPQRNRASIMGLFLYGRAAGQRWVRRSPALLVLRRFYGAQDGSGCSLSKAYWRLAPGMIHLFWLDDTPQQARVFLARKKERA